MRKLLPIESCMRCYNLQWQYDHEYYYCNKLGKVVQPEKGIPKDCPLETIEKVNKGK